MAGRKRREKSLDEIEFEALKKTKKKVYGTRKPSGSELLELLESRYFKVEVLRRRIRNEGRAA